MEILLKPAHTHTKTPKVFMLIFLLKKINKKKKTQHLFMKNLITSSFFFAEFF